MAGHKLQSARAVAVEVLDRCDPNKNYAGTILDSLRYQTDQSQRATDLVFGTLRNRLAIDTVIVTFSGRPVKRIQGRLLNIIRVGTYELIYCPSTEQYAVVNEAVAIAKTAGRATQSGFVNAVLRQITRHISNRQIQFTESDPNRTLVADARTGCQFDADFLPDRLTNPAEYFSTVFSLHRWLVADWLAEFGEESTQQVCLASNRRPSLYIRPNRLRTTIEALAERLQAGEVGFEIVPDAGMICIKSPHNITQLPGFDEGLFTVQDITAARPVRMLMHCQFPIAECQFSNRKFHPPEVWRTRIENRKFLDLCAAPGTKTTQLAEITGDLACRRTGKAKIIATDIDGRRLEMVKENTARLGIKNIEIVPYPNRCSSFVSRRSSHETRDTIHEKFDCVLLDVPCSNTGVLSRRVEARYRVSPEAIDKLADTQAGLLETAAGLVRPSGLICYSTCSIQKTENSEQIEKFLEKNKNFSLEKEQLTLPSAETPDHDGGYFAILVKR